MGTCCWQVMELVFAGFGSCLVKSLKNLTLQIKYLRVKAAFLYKKVMDSSETFISLKATRKKSSHVSWTLLWPLLDLLTWQPKYGIWIIWCCWELWCMMKKCPLWLLILVLFSLVIWRYFHICLFPTSSKFSWHGERSVCLGPRKVPWNAKFSKWKGCLETHPDWSNWAR